MPVFELQKSMGHYQSLPCDTVAIYGIDACCEMVLADLISGCGGEFSRFECLRYSEHTITFKLAQLIHKVSSSHYAAKDSFSTLGDFDHSVMHITMVVEKDLPLFAYRINLTFNLADKPQVNPSVYSPLDDTTIGFNPSMVTTTSTAHSFDKDLMFAALYGMDADKISKMAVQSVVKGVAGKLTGGVSEEFLQSLQTIKDNIKAVEPKIVTNVITLDSLSAINDVWEDEYLMAPLAPKPKGPQPYKKYIVPKKLGANKKGK